MELRIYREVVPHAFVQKNLQCAARAVHLPHAPVPTPCPIVPTLAVSLHITRERACQFLCRHLGAFGKHQVFFEPPPPQSGTDGLAVRFILGQPAVVKQGDKLELLSGVGFGVTDGTLQGGRTPTRATTAEVARMIRATDDAHRIAAGPSDRNLQRSGQQSGYVHAPAGVNALFRAGRVGGAFPAMEGELRPIVERQASSRCDARLPRLQGHYVALPLALRHDRRRFVRLWPGYISTLTAQGAALASHSAPPWPGADAEKEDLFGLMMSGRGTHEPQRGPASLQWQRDDAVDFLAAITTTKIVLCRILVNLAVALPKIAIPTEAAMETLLLWSTIIHDGPDGHNIIRTREQGEATPPKNDTTIIPRFLRQHHATLVSWTGNHVDTMGTGVEDTIVLTGLGMFEFDADDLGVKGSGEIQELPFAAKGIACYKVGIMLATRVAYWSPSRSQAHCIVLWYCSSMPRVGNMLFPTLARNTRGGKDRVLVADSESDRNVFFHCATGCMDAAGVCPAQFTVSTSRKQPVSKTCSHSFLFLFPLMKPLRTTPGPGWLLGH